MGRADVMVQFGPLRYLTEMKQDSDDNSRAYIKSKYLTQEAEYTNTNAPFGQLLVLDLTPKTTSSEPCASTNSPGSPATAPAARPLTGLSWPASSPATASPHPPTHADRTDAEIRLSPLRFRS